MPRRTKSLLLVYESYLPNFVGVDVLVGVFVGVGVFVDVCVGVQVDVGVFVGVAVLGGVTTVTDFMRVMCSPVSFS